MGKVKSGWSGSRMRNECGRGAVITNSRSRLINHNEGYFYPEQWFALQPKRATNSKRGVETATSQYLEIVIVICGWQKIISYLDNKVHIYTTSSTNKL